jgi:hypothetical protein
MAQERAFAGGRAQLDLGQAFGHRFGGYDPKTSGFHARASRCNSGSSFSTVKTECAIAPFTEIVLSPFASMNF